jgi:DNA-binding NtrC family response regulator
VCRHFDSAKEAVKMTSVLYTYIPQSIGNVANSVLWCVKESNKYLKRSSTDTKKKTEEKLCLKTGKVLEIFQSVTKAAQSMGVTHFTLSCALTRGYTCQGFGW